QLIDLCDRLTLVKQKKGIEVTVLGVAPSGRENLAYQAAELFFKEAGVRAGVKIQIEKRIPMGGGLGGGSSNAVATLWGLARLYGLDLLLEDLIALGAQLGSDVPFFFFPGTALAEGRGERLRPLPPLPPLWVVVANPGFSVSTAWAYQRLSLGLTNADENRKIASLMEMASLMEKGEGEKALSLSFNRFEEVVLPACPEIASLKRRLFAMGVRPALMAGSGSSVFGFVQDRLHGEVVVEELRRDGSFAVLCRTLDRNPMFDAEVRSEKF
ncbi:MAG: 4-(cytidine 5'-diphospho)-2-C-methyl-D-erythritol kinase, partial [Candidatus Methylomirabilales bacterium]